MPKTTYLTRKDSSFVSVNMTQEALIKALIKHGITATKVIKPIAEALEASKVIIHNGDNPDDSWTEEVPDWGVRMKAAAMGIDLLGLKKSDNKLPKTTDGFNKELNTAMKNMNEVELQRAVFKKSDTN